MAAVLSYFDGVGTPSIFERGIEEIEIILTQLHSLYNESNCICCIFIFIYLFIYLLIYLFINQPIAHT